MDSGGWAEAMASEVGGLKVEGTFVLNSGFNSARFVDGSDSFYGGTVAKSTLCVFVERGKARRR